MCRKAIEAQLVADNGQAADRQSYLGMITQVAGGGVDKYWSESEVYRCKGGNQQLAMKLADGFGKERITLKLPVTKIEQQGEKVVVATVVATRRSAPRPVGTSLAVSESGRMCGSVSGGCVESDVYENAREVMESGTPKLLSYGIKDEEAWEVGLPCGGEIDVFVERVE